MRKHFLFSVILLLFAWHHTLLAQGNSNPFDLVYRVDSLKTGEQSRQPTPFITDNPFDIVRVTVLDPEIRQNSIEVQRQANLLERQVNEKRLQFILLMFSLAFLVFVFVFFRSYVKKTIRAFYSDNLLRQFKRDMRLGIDTPFIILFFNYFFNLSIFVFFTFQESRIGGFNPYTQFVVLFGLIAALHFGKQLLLNFTAAILPIKTEIGLYIFTIVVFGSVIGVLLIPFNILLLYGPENSIELTRYSLLLCLIAIFLFRYFRAFYFSSRFIMFNKMHFLLYICSVEVAPVLIVIRSIMKGSMPT